MKLLVSNVGSTSLKFKLFEMPEETILCEGKVERVGSLDSGIFSYTNRLNGAKKYLADLKIPTYADGIRLFLSHMTDVDDGVVTSVLIGASRPQQILENLKVLGSADFTEEELREIDACSLEL